MQGQKGNILVLFTLLAMVCFQTIECAHHIHDLWSRHRRSQPYANEHI